MKLPKLKNRPSAVENLNLFTVVLRAQEAPMLNRAQLHRLARAQRAHNVYLNHRATLVDSDDDDGPQDEDAWLLEDLKVLHQLYSKLRSREQLIELIFEVRTTFLNSVRLAQVRYITGVNSRFAQRHDHHILLTTCSSLSCCKYWGLHK